MNHGHSWRHLIGYVSAPLVALLRRRPSRIEIIVLLAMVLGLLLTSTALAEPTPVTYYACVNNYTGLIRMVSASGKCLKVEHEISWNQVGPQGAAGPTGPQGPAGPQGPQGPAGTGVDLHGLDLTGHDFSNQVLVGYNLSGANLTIANLRGAILIGANLSGATLQAAYLNFANLSGANLQNATLFRANLSGADLSGADLSGADLGGATTIGIILDNTICPDGSNSNTRTPQSCS